MKYILIVLAVTTCSVLSVNKPDKEPIKKSPDVIHEEILRLHEILSR